MSSDTDANSGASSEEGYTLDEITVADASSLSGTITGTAIGNFTEWFDFGVYSYVIPVISTVFFPDQSAWATVGAFAALAVSFLIRPIGGIFWGMLGDRIGRKRILAATVVLMAFGTFALGLVPSYHTIGFWAPLCLFALRGIQGFSTGGEYVGAMTFLVEHSPDKRRGHVCSFLPVGTLTGYIAGAVIVIVMRLAVPHDALLSWGWRVPFLLAGPLGLVGLYVRMHLEESPAYEKESEQDDMAQVGGFRQFLDTIAQQWRPLLVCAGLVLSFNVTNYMLTGYMPDFLEEKLHMVAMNKTAALQIVVIVMAILAILVTVLGKLSDTVGRRPVMWTGSILLVLISIPMFYLIIGANGDYLLTFLGTLPMGLMLVCFMSTEPSTLPTLFPTNVRSGATAIGFNISVSAFGGTTPLIAAALVKATGSLMMPAYILVIAGVVGIVSVYFLPEVAGKPLLGSGPTVESEAEAKRMAVDYPPKRKKRRPPFGRKPKQSHGGG